MPDISKCSGDECKKKEYCYRYTSKADYMQSYFTNPPLKEDGSCDEYLEDLRTTKDSNPGMDTWRLGCPTCEDDIEKCKC